jgi:hypothetical protein
MTLKMFNKCIPEIVLLERGERIDESQIERICDFIDSRFDCADFRMLCVLRILYAYRDLVSERSVLRMKRTVLSFKYWMDEPGEDSMCYWSENHQIIFHACEFLAGKLYPEESFTNSGLTGEEHVLKARPKILTWLSWRWKYGFSEWHSNVYYEEDIAPLALLLDFSSDHEIRRKTAIVLDLLFLDMAMHSFRGLFAAASGRCYEEQKTDPRKQFTLPLTELLGGFRYLDRPDYGGLWTHFLLCKNYSIPEVLREIARDETEAVIEDSMGLDLPEVFREFPDPCDLDTTGMFLWGMEAFTAPESIELTLEIFDRWNLKTNGFLTDLSAVNSPVLRRLRLLPFLVRLLNPATQGVTIGRANTYTYRTGRYMLSTAQNHHPGTFGDQQHLWQATLSPEITVFATHPGCSGFDDQARNFSPSYWVGNGRMPHAAQDRNVHLSVYRIRGRRGYLERRRERFTHAWFPSEKFDRFVHDGRYVFGDHEGAFVALIGKNELAFRDRDRTDLIQRGADTFWVCELGTAGEWGSFDRFIASVKGRELSYSRGTLRYRAADRALELTYKGKFKVNGRIVDTAYPRLETPWVKAGRKPAELTIRAGGKSLYLNFETMERKEW